MSGIYCSNCGTKHLVGAKFCSNCGNKMSIFAEAKGRVPATKPKSFRLEDDEYEVPDTFVKPVKLEYDIEKSTNRYSVKDIISRPPSARESRNDLSLKNENFSSKEDYLKYSMKQCSSSRNLTDIDED